MSDWVGLVLADRVSKHYSQSSSLYRFNRVRQVRMQGYPAIPAQHTLEPT